MKTTYPSSTQFQQDIHIVVVFEETMKSHNVFVLNAAVNVDFLSHLSHKK